MRTLTHYEQMNVSGAGEHFDTFSVYGATTGAALMSPIALIMATFACDSPYAPPQTFYLAFAMIDGLGYFAGAVLGGAIGASYDLFERK